MNAFERRLGECRDELEWLYMELYDDRAKLDELEKAMADAYAARSLSLKRLDSRREAGETHAPRQHKHSAALKRKPA